MLSRAGLTEALGVTGAFRMSSTSFGGCLYPACAKPTLAMSSTARIASDLWPLMIGSSANRDKRRSFVECSKENEASATYYGWERLSTTRIASSKKYSKWVSLPQIKKYSK